MPRWAPCPLCELRRCSVCGGKALGVKQENLFPFAPQLNTQYKCSCCGYHYSPLRVEVTVTVSKRGRVYTA